MSGRKEAERMRDEKKEKKIRYPAVLCGMQKRDHAGRGIYMDPDETEKRDICPSEMFEEEKVVKVRVSILGASAVRDYDDETAIRLFRELSCRKPEGCIPYADC